MTRASNFWSTTTSIQRSMNLMMNFEFERKKKTSFKHQNTHTRDRRRHALPLTLEHCWFLFIIYSTTIDGYFYFFWKKTHWTFVKREERRMDEIMIKLNHTHTHPYADKNIESLIEKKQRTTFNEQKKRRGWDHRDHITRNQLDTLIYRYIYNNNLNFCHCLISILPGFCFHFFLHSINENEIIFYV
mgnify:CR=1 FL=1